MALLWNALAGTARIQGPERRFRPLFSSPFRLLKSQTSGEGAGGWGEATACATPKTASFLVNCVSPDRETAYPSAVPLARRDSIKGQTSGREPGVGYGPRQPAISASDGPSPLSGSARILPGWPGAGGLHQDEGRAPGFRATLQLPYPRGRGPTTTRKPMQLERCRRWARSRTNVRASSAKKFQAPPFRTNSSSL